MTAIDHIILNVNEIADSVDFYVNVLGFKFEGEDGPFTVIRVCEDFPDVNDIIEEHEEELAHPRHFRLRRGVVFLPRRDGTLAEALSMKLVDYKMRFERLLARAWTEFVEHEEDTESVGRGEGIDDFYRPVHHYTRKRPGRR